MIASFTLHIVVLLGAICGVPGLESSSTPPLTHVTELTSLTYRDFIKSHKHVLVEV